VTWPISFVPSFITHCINGPEPTECDGSFSFGWLKMAKRFNIQTADRDGLVDRVTQLTSALVKQKDAISKLKGSEENLLAENERLQKQIRILEEEGSVARELRSELQNEVARLQRSIDLLSAEMQMHRGETSTSLAREIEVSQTETFVVAKNTTAAANENAASSTLSDGRNCFSSSLDQGSMSDGFREYLLSMNEFLLQISDLSSNSGTEPATTAVDHIETRPENCSGSATQEAIMFLSAKAAGLLEKNISLIDMLTSPPSVLVTAISQVKGVSGKSAESGDRSAPADGDMNGHHDVNESDLRLDNSTKQLGKELQAAEQGRLQAEERLRKTHQAYIQAKKCIEDLERVATEREKEISALKQAQQRRGDAEAAEFQRREQEAARLAAAEAQIANRDAELRAAEERLAQSAREVKSLQTRQAAAATATQEREAVLETTIRRAEEKEAQARRETESVRAALETARKELRQAQEEKALQLEVDKKIIRGLQSEGRARVAELEARIATLEALLRDPHSDAAVGFLGSPGQPPDDSRPATPGAPSTPATLPITAIGVFNPSAAGAGAAAAGLESAVETDFGWRGAQAEELGGARGEELVRRALRAMEEMVEALMRRPDLCRRIDADLAALERELGPTAGRKGADAVERRVEALCGVVQMAADYLQEIPCPDHRSLAHHRELSLADGGGGGGGWRQWARVILCACCLRGRAVGPEYVPVRSSADYDEAF
jgi:hypothetical protein